jgi:hypothetical protein
MRRLAPLLLIAALAGCASSGSLFHQDEPRPEPLVNEAAPQSGPQTSAPQAPNRGNLSPAAAAAAPPPDASDSTGELMDCVTQSCKINCSPKVAARFRPKWCARFKEPI